MSIYSEKISLRYNKINILENIDIEIKKGEILSIQDLMALESHPY